MSRAAGPDQEEAECPAAATVGVAQSPKRPDGGTATSSQVAYCCQAKSEGAQRKPRRTPGREIARRGHASAVPRPAPEPACEPVVQAVPVPMPMPAAAQVTAEAPARISRHAHAGRSGGRVSGPAVLTLITFCNDALRSVNFR